MNNFKAYRYGGKVVIDGKAEYLQGELLTYYLNTDFSKLEQKYLDCLKNEHKVLFPYGDRNYDYNKVVHAVQGFFSYVDKLTASLPPYNKVLNQDQPADGALYALLSTQSILFRDSGDDDDEYPYDDHMPIMPDDWDLDDYDIDNNGIDHEERYRQKNYNSPPPGPSGDDILMDYTPEYYTNILEPVAIELNKRIKRLYDRYMTFTAGILRIKIYADFLDNHVHKDNVFQDPARLAQAYSDFQAALKNKVNPKVYERFAEASDISVSHGVLQFEDERGAKTSRLWEITEYDGVGSFLYTELFNCLQTGFLPKRCYNCGRYFLLTSGYTPDFCDELAPGDSGKTCREIGSRKKYDDKVKNDPVWRTYQRAYKAHYARVLKKTMTKPDFAVWADEAITLRGKALVGEIPFDEYAAELKK